MKLQFNFSLELTEAEMATGNIGGLDFSQLISAVNNVKDTLTGVVTRLQNVAPQAGSTDAASSAAAQQELNALAEQLNTAVQSLNQVNQSAQVAAGQQPAAPVSPAVAGAPQDTQGMQPATGPVETGENTPPPSGTNPTPGA